MCKQVTLEAATVANRVANRGAAGSPAATEQMTSSPAGWEAVQAWSWSLCCVGPLALQVQGGAWTAQVSPAPTRRSCSQMALAWLRGIGLDSLVSRQMLRPTQAPTMAFCHLQLRSPSDGAASPRDLAFLENLWESLKAATT